MAAKNRPQLAIISTPAPPTAASPRPRKPVISCRRPVAAPQASRAASPNRQRNQTVVAGSCPASATKMPMVPSRAPAAAIRA